MTVAEFNEKLAELLEYDGILTEDVQFADVKEYDSLAIMGIVAFVFSNFKKKIPGKDLTGVKTVRELIDLIGREHISG